MSEKTTERTRSVDIDYEGETRNVSVQDVPLGSNVEKSSETIAEEPRRERKPDTGFAWVILFMGMLNFIIAFGNFVAFGVFQTYYLKVMFVDQKAASIAWVGTLTNAMAQSCGVLTGPLAFYIGVRGVMIFAGVTGVTALVLASFSTKLWQLILTQGFLYGLSSGIVANMTFTVVSGWFEVKRTPALTLLSIGGVLGGLVLVPTVTESINSLSIGWAFRILAILFFVIFAAGSVLMRLRVDFKFSRNVLNLKQLKDPFLLLVCGAQFFFNAGYLVPLLYFPASIIDLGMSNNSGYNLIIAFCGAALVSRFVLTFIGDILGPLNIIIVSNVVTASLMLGLWLPNDSITLHIVFYVIFGLFSSTMIALGPVLVAKKYYNHAMSQANGLLFLFTGISTVTTTPFIGFIFDKFGNRTDYSPIIICGACCYFISAAILIVLRVYCRRNIPANKTGPL